MIGIHSEDNYTPILDGISIKTLVHGRDTLMVEFRLSKGSVLPEHSHPFEQTGYLVSGMITLFIADSPFTMKPGDSWCIPSGAVHSAEINKDSCAIEIFSPLREDYLKYLSEGEIIRNDI